MTGPGMARSPGTMAKGAATRVARAMGPRRMAAAARIGARLTLGRPRRWLTLHAGLWRTQADLAEGRVGDARAAVDELVQAFPANPRALERRADVLLLQGEVTEPARMVYRANRRTSTPRGLDAERRLIGRVVETSPGWLPRIPGPPRPVAPTPGVVLHLLKESSPHLTNGFTMRSRYNLIAARDAGVRPVVVTSLGFPRSAGVEHPERMEVVDGIPHHRLDLGPYYPRRRAPDQVLVDQAWLTAGVARAVAPSVIHASSGFRGYESALVGLALRDHLRRPLVYEVRSFFESTWSQDERWNHSGEMYERRFATESRAMTAADHVITIAEAMRADIIGRGLPSERVTIIPNGVDADAFTPRDPDPSIRARHRLGDRFVFGYVSNLDHRRENQELLIEATAILLRRGRHVACLVIGDGRRRAELEAIARDAGVGDAVAFTGSIPHDQVRDYYAVLDAFVVPRRDERASRAVTPLKPYEALAMGRPLVVADLPALVEIAHPEDRGLAFRAGDASSLADRLERLIDDPALGRRLGAAGRAWVAAERSWTTNGTRLRELYREVEARWAAGERRSAP